VTLYDKEGLKIVSGHLKDADPTVREAAREGLIQLGDSDAIPLLERAAAENPNPEEANKLKEAAEFLRLPSLDGAQLAKAARGAKSQQSPVTGLRPSVKNPILRKRAILSAD
jgi:hypothetical protein